jgi:hypothetical protein
MYGEREGETESEDQQKRERERKRNKQKETMELLDLIIHCLMQRSQTQSCRQAASTHF